jgi:membrane-associated phospholipid phosphatase
MSRRRPTMRELGLDRLNIFVPALMSVGLLFWFAEILRDALRWRGARARQQRSERSGRAVAALTVGRRGDTGTDAAELRPRAAYGVWSVVFLVVALYIAIGALLNYTRVGGYVSDIAWLLALALTLAAAFGFAAGVSSALWLRWHDPPRWLRATAVRTRLAANTAFDEPGVPGWRLTTAVLVTSVVAAMFALMVGASPHVVDGLDESVSNWVRSRDIFDALRFIDPWGSTAVSLALAVVIGLAALRCRPAALTVAGAIVIGLALHASLQGVVERPRPDAEDILANAFPSGHVLLAVALAGLLPLALVAITGRKRLGPPVGALAVVVAGAGAIHQVHEGTHWPSDVVGAGLIGLAIALAAWWVIEHQRWHARCRGCVWAPAGHEPRRRGALHVTAHRLPTIRRLAHLAGAAAALGLAVLTITVGVPANPEGTVFGPAIATPVQLAFAGMVSVGALLAWRWDAAGAVVIALAAAGLGIFAAVEYAPAFAVALTIALLIPAVLLWIGWQHRRTWAEIVALAAFTTVLLGATAYGAQQVYDHFFGPTHPESTAVGLPVDRVEWAWTGGLQSDAITIVAKLDGSNATTTTEVVLTSDTGPEVRIGPVTSDDHGVVRVDASDLRPDSQYRFQFVIDGEPDSTRGIGSFRAKSAADTRYWSWKIPPRSP